MAITLQMSKHDAQVSQVVELQLGKLMTEYLRNCGHTDVHVTQAHSQSAYDPHTNKPLLHVAVTLQTE